MMPDTVSERLVAQLEAQAKLVDQGAFTLDETAARSKLAQYRLAEPADWVCLVVEAANLVGATRVEVLGQVTRITIRFDGEPLDGEAIFGGAAASEGVDEDSARLAARKLAIAISTLFDHYAVEAVDIESPLGLVRRNATGPNERSTSEERRNTLCVRGLESSQDACSRLVERCRYSPMAIVVEYKRISCGMRQWLVEQGARGITAIVDGERTIGHVGWSPDSSPGSIQLLTHGVATERVTSPNWEGLAIIDVPLRKDVGERAVLRDAEFERIMAIVEAAAREVRRDVPPEPTAVAHRSPSAVKAADDALLFVYGVIGMSILVFILALAFL